MHPSDFTLVVNGNMYFTEFSVPLRTVNLQYYILGNDIKLQLIVTDNILVFYPFITILVPTQVTWI